MITSEFIVTYSYTPRTLRECCSQSKFRMLKYAKVARVHYFCTVALQTSEQC